MNEGYPVQKMKATDVRLQQTGVSWKEDLEGNWWLCNWDGGETVDCTGPFVDTRGNV